MVDFPPHHGDTSCCPAVVWVKHLNLLIHSEESLLKRLIQISRIFRNLLSNFNWHSLSTMLGYLFATMPIKYRKETNVLLSSNLILVAVRVFHVWTELPVLVFSVTVLSHWAAIAHMPPNILCEWWHTRSKHTLESITMLLLLLWFRLSLRLVSTKASRKGWLLLLPRVTRIVSSSLFFFCAVE